MMLFRIISHQYAGDGATAAFGVLALVMASYPWFRFRSMRKTGQKVELSNVIAMSLLFLMFSVMAFADLIAHR